MLVTVQVTPAHIAIGTRGDCGNCPVWHAVKPLLREGVRVSVSPWNLWLDGTAVLLPAPLGRFILDFDSDFPVAPVSAEMEIADEFLRSET